MLAIDTQLINKEIYMERLNILSFLFIKHSWIAIILIMPNNNLVNRLAFIFDNIINCKINTPSRLHYFLLKNTKKNTQNPTIGLHVCKIYVKFKGENSRSSLHLSRLFSRPYMLNNRTQMPENQGGFHPC